MGQDKFQPKTGLDKAQEIIKHAKRGQQQRETELHGAVEQRVQIFTQRRALLVEAQEELEKVSNIAQSAAKDSLSEDALEELAAEEQKLKGQVNDLVEGVFSCFERKLGDFSSFEPHFETRVEEFLKQKKTTDKAEYDAEQGLIENAVRSFGKERFDAEDKAYVDELKRGLAEVLETNESLHRAETQKETAVAEAREEIEVIEGLLSKKRSALKSSADRLSRELENIEKLKDPDQRPSVLLRKIAADIQKKTRPFIDSQLRERLKDFVADDDVLKHLDEAHNATCIARRKIKVAEDAFNELAIDKWQRVATDRAAFLSSAKSLGVELSTPFRYESVVNSRVEEEIRNEALKSYPAFQANEKERAAQCMKRLFDSVHYRANQG